MASLELEVGLDVLLLEMGGVLLFEDYIPPIPPIPPVPPANLEVSQVLIDGVKVELKKGSLLVELRIEERSIAEFTVIDTAGVLSYQKGQPVEIYDVTNTLIFGGVIDTPEKTTMAPSGGLYHPIRCVDWHYLADKRLVAESYLATSAGDIVKDIRTKYLVAEGVTVGNIEDGPDIVEAVFNYVRASEAYDALAEKAGKIWYIDENKALYFVNRDTTPAPWNWTTHTPKPAGSKAFLSGGNPKYRNRQYIRGGRGTTALQTETFTGDGVTVAFTVGFPFQQAPTVTVNAVARTIGIKGIDVAKDCYWNKGDATLTFDAGSTPGAVAVVIKYYGQFDILVLAEDIVAIADQLAIEGAGTGYVDEISDEPKLDDKDASIDAAKAKLVRYAVTGQRFEYETLLTGLKPGQLQTINYPALGLNNAEMLIEAVSIRGAGSNNHHRITAIQGPTMGSWSDFFKALAHMKAEIIDRLNVGSDQILIVLVSRSETWKWTESITETPFACPICSPTTICGPTVIVC